MNGATGRHYTEALLNTIAGDYMDYLPHHTKQRARCIDVIDKAKCELNVPDVDETFVDLCDYIDDDEFADEVEITAEMMRESGETLNLIWEKAFGHVKDVCYDDDGGDGQ